MSTFARNLSFGLLLSITTLVVADDLQLNGIGSFEQLRKEYYIGGLYLPTLNSEPVIVEAMDGPKRMELRITADRWTARRFAQWCNQSVPINNGPAALGQHADDLLALTNAVQGDLLNGDILAIEQTASGSSRITLNGNTLLQTSNKGLFELLLNTWIGAIPPSSGFKQGILQLPTDSDGTALLTRYEDVSPTAARRKETAQWTTRDAEPAAVAASATAVAAVAAAQDRAGSALPPPGGDTVVRARVSETPKATPSREVVTTRSSQAALQAPDIQLDKPKLLATAETAAVAQAASRPPAAQPKPEPTPEPESEPKPEPKPDARPAPAAAPAPAAQAEDEDDEQDGLLMAYRSNIMKLTYLNTQYPKRALDLRQEGLVVINLKLSRNGKILDLSFAQEAKYGALNTAAERAIKRSEPYPEAPSSLKGNTIELELPFNFKL